MADPIWELMFKDEHVSITLDDLTRHRMRELGAELGEDFRVPSYFMARLAVGDFEAVAGALWIHGQVVGKPVGRLLELDFSDADFKAVPTKPKRAPKGSKPTGDTSEARTGSPRTPSTSETDSSS